jgi:hypothetical protein
MEAPTPEEIGSTTSTVAPWAIADCAWVNSVDSLPCAFVMMYWLEVRPAASKAFLR